MEEENGGKIAECGESSITPPVNNSERKRLLLKLSVPTKMELFLISFCCVLPHSTDEHSLFHKQASTHLTLDCLKSPAEIQHYASCYKISDSFPLISCEVWESVFGGALHPNLEPRLTLTAPREESAQEQLSVRRTRRAHRTNTNSYSINQRCTGPHVDSSLCEKPSGVRALKHQLTASSPV